MDAEELFTLDEAPILLFPSLAERLGLAEAIILQQMHYWLTGDKAQERDNHLWIRCTITELQKSFPWWHESTIKRALNNLRDLKLLVVAEKSKGTFDKSLWYRINYAELDNLDVAESDTENDTESEVANILQMYKDGYFDRLGQRIRTKNKPLLKSPRNPGYIYLMQVNDSHTYKIGLSKNPERRLRQLSRELPDSQEIAIVHLHKVENMLEAEKTLHTMFSEKAVHVNEWFVLSSQDVEMFERWGKGQES